MAATRSILALSLCFLVSIKSACGQGCGVETLSCSVCVSSPLGCAWCPDEGFMTPRCFGQGGSENCSSLQMPQTEFTITKNEEISDAVQIQPQRIEANLRTGDPVMLNFTVKLAPTFPLDVYFIMDFSGTMGRDLRSLRDISDDVAESVRTITPNFQLGFGSFVDKPTHPFVQIGPLSYQTQETNAIETTNNCILTGICAAPYVFRNHQSLTNDTQAFAAAIAGSKISTNFDQPEALLDAMVQVLACRSIIGWRDPPVQHLLVVITDADFHVAGDGKLGAAVRRNLGRCLMENSEAYNGTDAIQVDYPSVGLVAKLLAQENVIPIYMITRNRLIESTYTSLANLTGGTVTFLIDGARDVNDAIRRQYNTIRTGVSFTSNEIEGLDVSIVTNCTEANSVESPNSCANVTTNITIGFTVELNIKECTEELSNGVDLVISDRFAGSVVVRVTGLCGCDCERTREVNSSQCSENGTLVCGVCQCNPGRFGGSCQCIDEDPSDGVPTTDACPLGVNGEQCSGSMAGNCSCGDCTCNPIFSSSTSPRVIIGDYYHGLLMACECSDYNCPIMGDNMCSGRGTCNCSECHCEPGYSGAACQCSPPNEVCVKPGEVRNQLCSGKGQCECNNCNCNSGYAGRYCEMCNSADTCTEEDCAIYSTCVSCSFGIVGSTLQQQDLAACESQCGNIEIRQVGSTNEISNPDSVHRCTMPLVGDTCVVEYYFQFIQGTETQSTLYVINSVTNCFTFPPWAIALIIFILLLILAIVLILLLKLLLYILDRIEYQRFQKEVASTRFGENVNPLYHQPETQHANPLFAGKTAPPPPPEGAAADDDLPKKML